MVKAQESMEKETLGITEFDKISWKNSFADLINIVQEFAKLPLVCISF